MLDQETVQKVADLAKLDLQANEVQQIQKDFENILNYFDQINTVNTTGVEPLLSPSPLEFYADEDKAEPFADATDKFLSAAPERQGNLFKVPPVV